MPSRSNNNEDAETEKDMRFYLYELLRQLIPLFLRRRMPSLLTSIQYPPALHNGRRAIISSHLGAVEACSRPLG